MRAAEAVSVPAPDETETAALLEAVASVPILAALRAMLCSLAVAAAALLRASERDVWSSDTRRSSACLRAVAAASAVSAAVLRCDWLRQPIENAAALTSPPQTKARPVSSQTERGDLRRAGRATCGNGVRRSSRTGQRAWVVESEVTPSASPPGRALLLPRPPPGLEYPYYS